MNPFYTRDVPEAEVLDWLTTHGRIPAEFSFVLGKRMLRWHAESGSLQAYYIDDHPLFDACCK
jgi:hypothetical protein